MIVYENIETDESALAYKLNSSIDNIKEARETLSNSDPKQKLPLSVYALLDDAVNLLRSLRKSIGNVGHLGGGAPGIKPNSP